jgi:hypothetical protein
MWPEHKRDLFDATSYEVQSSVPLGIFAVFVKALETGGKIGENAHGERQKSEKMKRYEWTI